MIPGSIVRGWNGRLIQEGGTAGHEVCHKKAHKNRGPKIIIIPVPLSGNRAKFAIDIYVFVNWNGNWLATYGFFDLEIMDQAVAGFAAGASASYLVGLGLGVAPPLIGGREKREWARDQWRPQACELMDTLDKNWKYMNIKAKFSNRNFVQVQPEATRVRLVCYTSIWDRQMRGVAKFGQPAGPNKCICGGAVAAAADQVLGLFAISMILFPVVTANLDVQFKESVPLGSELGFICKIEVGSDSIKKLIVSLSFYSLEPKDEGKELVKVTAIFVNSILPQFIKSML